ncbi:MAG TPA: YdjY domain-containing protein [Tepidisphaeraceae bacterium]|nr:YdjY domain-containing protein [Tepidisphaeraceae bacterium]
MSRNHKTPFIAKRLPWLMLSLLGVMGTFPVTPQTALGQFGEEPSAKQDSVAEDQAAVVAKTVYEQNKRQYANNPNFLVLPGILADRTAKTIRIWGRATSLTYGDPVEFFLIPADSGKDYEALFVGFVKPSDVHRALEFIGMKAGRSVDFRANHWWPKGERVLMSAEWNQPASKDAPGPSKMQRVRVEELVIDVQTRQPLPQTGLVFTGSYRIQSEVPDRKDLYAADAVDPRSIASDFNEATSVLDVPRLAIKGEVYGTQKLNPAYRFSAGQSVQLVMEPEYKDGRSRVRDLRLQVSIPAGNAAAGIRAARFTLTDEKGKLVGDGNTLVHLLAAFSKITEAGQDPFVTVDADGALALGQVREFYKLLMAMDTENGIRVEAPPEGQLFYRAFFPKPEWRDRSKRLGRPWELHATSQNGVPAATLILPADEIDDNGGLGDLKFEVKTGEDVARILAEKSDRWSQMVYVFAPSDMTYASLLSLVRPGMKTHPTLYVFPPN